MTQELRTFLTFQDGAATRHSICTAASSTTSSSGRIDHYGPGDGGPEGTIKVAVPSRRLGLQLCRQPHRSRMGFTPQCPSGSTATTATNSSDSSIGLSNGGQVFMPLDDYGFSTRFGWVGDRHGVTWQLNLP